MDPNPADSYLLPFVNGARRHGLLGVAGLAFFLLGCGNASDSPETHLKIYSDTLER
jgi:hypothetical protein